MPSRLTINRYKTWNLLLGLFAVAGTVLLGGGIATISSPLVQVAIVGMLFCVVFPQTVGLSALVLLVVSGSLFNPPIAGSYQSGRTYVSSALAIMIFLSGLGSLLQGGRRWPKRTLVVLGSVFIYVLILYRPASQDAVAWLYRPLQPVILAFGIAMLLRGRGDLARHLYQAMLAVAVLGSALGVLNALSPGFDPFVISRPSDLPFESRILFFVRATGGFVYPNVFGLFSAYVALAGAAAFTTRRVSPRLARWAVIVGAFGVLTSASRAALIGLTVGAIYLIAKSPIRKRAGRVATAGAVVMMSLIAVNVSATGRAVLQDRITDATGQSLQFRIQSTNYGLIRFTAQPFFGSGIEPSRLDNGLLLYLYTGGIVGATFLILALRQVGRLNDLPNNFAKLPLDVRAMFLCVATSSVLQDSLGQTISSWFLGATVGLLAVTNGEESLLVDDGLVIAGVGHRYTVDVKTRRASRLSAGSSHTPTD